MALAQPVAASASASALLSSTSSDTAAPTMNVLLTSFAGLGLPRTLSLPVPASTRICDILQTIHARLPPLDHPVIISTTSNKQLISSDDRPISSLTSSPSDTFLPLRLSSRLCGGKGGFGSQLRAAGGRMSSRKKKQQDTGGSNRNLDGRRLRTVDEAKKLAEYLAVKPEMEKKEKAERKKRWEAIVQAADKKEEDIKSGRAGANGGRLDGDYVEGKEMAEEKTREAVLRAMREEMGLQRTGSESSDEEGEGEMDSADEGASGSSSGSSENVKTGGVSFYGWDEEEGEDEDEDDMEEQEDSKDQESKPVAYEGKGKGRVTG